MTDEDRREGENDDDYLARKQAERQWALLTDEERQLHRKSLSKDNKLDPSRGKKDKE